MPDRSPGCAGTRARAAIAACGAARRTPRTAAVPPATRGGPRSTRRTSLTVVAAGDLLVHPPLTAQAAADARAAGRTGHDFTRVLAAVARPSAPPTSASATWRRRWPGRTARSPASRSSASRRSWRTRPPRRLRHLLDGLQPLPGHRRRGDRPHAGEPGPGRAAAHRHRPDGRRGGRAERARRLRRQGRPPVLHVQLQRHRAPARPGVVGEPHRAARRSSPRPPGRARPAPRS